MAKDLLMPDYDFIVIGSGFGGSVAALRLVEKGHRVAVLEMGRRWRTEDYPETNWHLARCFWRPSLGLRGFLSIRWFKHVTVLHGCAVGGGSIGFASVMLEPKPDIWNGGSWAGLAEWAEEMQPHYAEAKRMLGVVENRILGPADDLLRRAAEAHGTGDTFYRTRVAIFRPPEGEEGGRIYPDPYFGGQGPERSTCTGCGGCMVGCRFNAKNTLDKNYLYLAESLGVRIFAETKVVDVRPLEGAADGGLGYEVHTVDSASRRGKDRRRFTCRGIVFSAGALGTMELLLRLREGGSLPRLSANVGRHVRTNAESLIGVRVPDCSDDLSKGVAIGSGVYIDRDTHIEATRYPSGSDAMGMLATLLTGGRPGVWRIGLWLWTLLASFVRRPMRTIQLLWPGGLARQTVILLCMQALEGQIQMRLGRLWYWPFGKRLVSCGSRVPTFLPQANAFARKMAGLSGGRALSMNTEILFNTPATAHLLGGCAMAASAEEGVVDERQRVFGYENLYVCDGSVVSANLGVNPGLTITALAERAMSKVPAAKPAAADYSR